MIDVIFISKYSNKKAKKVNDIVSLFTIYFFMCTTNFILVMPNVIVEGTDDCTGKDYTFVLVYLHFFICNLTMASQI